MATANQIDPPILEYPGEQTPTAARRNVLRLPVIRPSDVALAPKPYPDIVVIGQQQPQAFQFTTAQILIGAVILYLLLKN